MPNEKETIRPVLKLSRLKIAKQSARNVCSNHTREFAAQAKGSVPLWRCSRAPSLDRYSSGYTIHAGVMLLRRAWGHGYANELFAEAKFTGVY